MASKIFFSLTIIAIILAFSFADSDSDKKDSPERKTAGPPPRIPEDRKDLEDNSDEDKKVERGGKSASAAAASDGDDRMDRDSNDAPGMVTAGIQSADDDNDNARRDDVSLPYFIGSLRRNLIKNHILRIDDDKFRNDPDASDKDSNTGSSDDKTEEVRRKSKDNKKSHDLATDIDKGKNTKKEKQANKKASRKKTKAPEYYDKFYKDLDKSKGGTKELVFDAKLTKLERGGKKSRPKKDDKHNNHSKYLPFLKENREPDTRKSLEDDDDPAEQKPPKSIKPFLDEFEFHESEITLEKRRDNVEKEDKIKKNHEVEKAKKRNGDHESVLSDLENDKRRNNDENISNMNSNPEGLPNDRKTKARKSDKYSVSAEKDADYDNLSVRRRHKNANAASLIKDQRKNLDEDEENEKNSQQNRDDDAKTKEENKDSQEKPKKIARMRPDALSSSEDEFDIRPKMNDEDLRRKSFYAAYDASNIEKSAEASIEKADSSKVLSAENPETNKIKDTSKRRMTHHSSCDNSDAKHKHDSSKEQHPKTEGDSSVDERMARRKDKHEEYHASDMNDEYMFVNDEELTESVVVKSTLGECKEGEDYEVINLVLEDIRKYDLICIQQVSWRSLGH